MNEFINRFCTDIDFFYDSIFVIVVVMFGFFAWGRFLK